MGAQIIAILVVTAVAYTMLWSALAKKQVVVVCRWCGQPRERCRCGGRRHRRRP